MESVHGNIAINSHLELVFVYIYKVYINYKSHFAVKSHT